MQLIKEKSSHWYKIEYPGTVCVPCHEWPKKDGTGMKKTTLREAKQHNLLPSVTNVIDTVINKPQLVNWRITQGIMAALTLPRVTGESEDTFAARVVDDMDAYSEEARDFGTLCHDHIAHYITHGEVLQDEAEPFTRSAREWITKNVMKVYGGEQRVFHPELRYAGQLDLDVEIRTLGRSIVDFKSQKVRKKGDEHTPVFYDEFPVQLAAYAECVRNSWGPDIPMPGGGAMVSDLPKLISIIINSDEPSRCFVQVYENPEYYLRLFKHALDWWAYKKGWDPRTQQAPDLGISDGTNTIALLQNSIEVEKLKTMRKGMEQAGL